MNREIHVRFWEGLGVRFPRATHCLDLERHVFHFDVQVAAEIRTSSLYECVICMLKPPD